MSREATKLARIAAAVAVMLGVVLAAGSLTPSSYAPLAPVNVLTADADALPNEAETFLQVTNSVALKENSQQKGGSRTLDQFDTRRAFPGAPPVIPHALFEDRTMGGKGCLGCHAGGGFVPQFKAYAPVTPHPDLLNCRQCHVPEPQKPHGEFATGNTWQKISGPPVDQEAIPGAPPPIPHSLQLRGNCVACHAGPGAVAEIRTPHPERANCRQCHVPAEHSGVFDRGGAR